MIWFTEPDPDDPESRWLADVSDAEDWIHGRVSGAQALVMLRTSVFDQALGIVTEGST